MGRFPSKGRIDPYRELRDYWRDRSRRLEQEYSPILTNLKSLTSQDQWSTVEYILEQIARETQELKRKKPRQPAPTTNNINQAKRNVRITGLSNHQLSRDEINLLSKGLNVIPTPRTDHPAKMLQDILLFDRKIKT